MNNWHKAKEKITIYKNGFSETYPRVTGESISLWGMKSLIPGLWINDEMMNCTLKRCLDETNTSD